ncbi:hypothetical protein [Kaistia sp. MMO-174]|uniref:hypothetical protein n=1 Tax=Kaistia sp. MMO-174 TaxID=3081256 RepID=UPI001AC60BF9|nr:hypothetical protein [Hyphomicrobiales bacterium]MBN9060346.1 hypothetical protein [Hyphomicrobiales bacterium]
MTQTSQDTTGENFGYQEREAVAVFDSEAALNAAVDALMQFGVRQADLSVLAPSDKISAPASALEDKEDAPRAAFVTSDSRVEGAAALTGGPALITGLGAALVAGTVGVAMIPALAVTIGGTLATGSAGFLLSRLFGRKHADAIHEQLKNGGLLLWVHAPEAKDDERILAILRNNGGRDAHVHVVHRRWGTDDVPFENAQPDPLLKL